MRESWMDWTKIRVRPWCDGDSDYGISYVFVDGGRVLVVLVEAVLHIELSAGRWVGISDEYL